MGAIGADTTVGPFDVSVGLIVAGEIRPGAEGGGRSAGTGGGAGGGGTSSFK
jgi:hypothetical protein